MTNAELVNNVETNAQRSKTIENGLVRSESYSLKDQIAAAEWVEKKRATQAAAGRNDGRFLFGGMRRVAKLG